MALESPLLWGFLQDGLVVALLWGFPQCGFGIPLALGVPFRIFLCARRSWQHFGGSLTGAVVPPRFGDTPRDGFEVSPQDHPVLCDTPSSVLGTLRSAPTLGAPRVLPQDRAVPPTQTPPQGPPDAQQDPLHPSPKEQGLPQCCVSIPGSFPPG